MRTFHIISWIIRRLCYLCAAAILASSAQVLTSCTSHDGLPSPYDLDDSDVMLFRFLIGMALVFLLVVFIRPPNSSE